MAGSILVELIAIAVADVNHAYGHFVSERGVEKGEDPHKITDEFLEYKLAEALKDEYGIQLKEGQADLIASLLETGGDEALHNYIQENRTK